MNYLSKLKEKAHNLSNQLIQSQPPALTKIAPQLYHCSYPESASPFKSLLKEFGCQKIQIWNLSEYEYKNDLKKGLIDVGGELHELLYEYYGSMPLTECINAVNKIKAFINENTKNYVLVHCQENKSRSCVFLASYLFLNDEITDVASAIAEVNKKLLVRSNETLYSSQHLILKSIANYHKDSSFINKHSLKLIKVIMNEAPRIAEVESEESLNIFLEIRKNGQVIYKKVTKQFGQGEIVQFNLKEEMVELEDDCLFSFKYIYGGKAYPVARIQINTNFVFNNFARVQKQEMDLCKNVKTKGQVFTDFLFETVQGKSSKLSKLNKKDEEIYVPFNQKIHEISEENYQNNTSEKKNESNEVKQEGKSEEVFHIDEDFGEHKGSFDEKETEERINKILNNMSIKEGQVEEQIKEENEDEENKKREKDNQSNGEQIASELVEEKGGFLKLQSTPENNEEKFVTEEQYKHKNKVLEKVEEKAEEKVEEKAEEKVSEKAEETVEEKVLEKVGMKVDEKLEGVESPSSKKIEDESESSSEDMDDYLNKLEEQADSS